MVVDGTLPASITAAARALRAGALVGTHPLAIQKQRTVKFRPFKLAV